MNAFVSKLPRNKKEPGFPVGGPRNEWCPRPHTPTGLSTGQKTGSANKSSVVSPIPWGWTLFFAAKFKQSSETSHWAQALNIKMASWGHRFSSTEFFNISPLYLTLLSVSCGLQDKTQSLLSHVPTHHTPIFQPHAQLMFHERTSAHTSSPVLAHTLSAAWERVTIVRKGSHGYLSLDYEPDRCCGKSFTPSSHCVHTLSHKALNLLADELTDLPGSSDQEVLSHKVRYI